MIVTIVNRRNNKIVFSKAYEAKSFFLKLRGLMFKKTITNDEALIFYRTSSIHTCFMRFPIDIIFLDINRKVIRIVDALGAWRMVYCKYAYYTIEAKGGTVSSKDIMVNDILEFRHEGNIQTILS